VRAKYLRQERHRSFDTHGQAFLGRPAAYVILNGEKFADALEHIFGRGRLFSVMLVEDFAAGGCSAGRYLGGDNPPSRRQAGSGRECMCALSYGEIMRLDLSQTIGLRV
jgi:hypothetical protein